MKEIIISVGIFIIIFIFTILTGSTGLVYNLTDNQLTTDFTNFKPSYNEATEIGNNLR